MKKNITYLCMAAAALLVGILLSQLCIGFASRWVKAILGVKAQNHMQLSYFGRLLHSEWQDRNRRHSGDILNRLERDVLDVVNTVTETVPSMAAVCLRLLGAFFFLYAMDATLGDQAVIYGENGRIELSPVCNWDGIRILDGSGTLIRHIPRPPQITGFDYEVQAAVEAIRAGQCETRQVPHATILRIMERMDQLRDSWGMKYPGED